MCLIVYITVYFTCDQDIRRLGFLTHIHNVKNVVDVGQFLTEVFNSSLDHPDPFQSHVEFSQWEGLRFLYWDPIVGQTVLPGPIK